MNLERNETELKLTSLVRKLILVAVLFFTATGFYAQCYETEGIAFSINSSGGNQDAGFETAYVLSDYLGTIIEVSTTTTFSGKDAGLYKAYAVNYDLSTPPSNLEVGTNISELQGDCIDISDGIDINICKLDCSIFDGNYSFNPQDDNPNLITSYLLVDEFLNILEISSSPSFSGIDVGNFLVFTINYEAMDNLAIGVSVNDLTGTTFDISNPVAISSCSNCDVYIGEDFEACKGLEILLTSSASSTGGSYSWNTGDTSPNIMITVSTTTEYVVTFTDDSGCEAVDSLLVTLLDSPMGNILGDGFICQGESTTLTAGGGSSYQWITGSTATTPEITVTPDATTEYSVVVFNSDFCTDTVSFVVLVEDCNVDCGYCVGETLTLSVLDGNSDLSNIFVLTDFSNIIVETSLDPEFQMLEVGEYKIFPINYDESKSSLAGLIPGANINDVTGVCFDIGSPFIFRACECGAIGNYVWNDEDSDGIQDDNEVGINEVTVNLYDSNNPTVPIATTMTGENPDDPLLGGYYIFEDLLPGDYYVEFVSPDGFSTTIPNSSAGEALDSDIDGSNGEGTTAIIKLIAGEVNLDVDAGFTLPVLPVEWLYIKGEWNSVRNVNKITWATASEINNSHFIVERSYENEGFEDIGKVDGQGESLETSTYEFDDADIERNGNYFYRLKQVDLDGTSDYSPTLVINVMRKGQLNVNIYPIPAYKELIVSIETSEEINLQAVIIDITGKVMMDNVLPKIMPEGKREVRIALDDLPVGTYILRMSSDENVVNHKILVLDR